MNEEISGNFISHLLDSGFDYVIKSLGTNLVLDSLLVLLVAFMGVLYSEKVYKHSNMSNVDNRAFIVIIPLQIPQKSYPVLYIWNDSESKGVEEKFIAGMTTIIT